MLVCRLNVVFLKAVDGGTIPDNTSGGGTDSNVLAAETTSTANGGTFDDTVGNSGKLGSRAATIATMAFDSNMSCAGALTAFGLNMSCAGALTAFGLNMSCAGALTTAFGLNMSCAGKVD
ncbi:hypothetical protein KC360_g6204 [Hortaea werneckii]|nr:hypothetical protein KC361_g8787 [Hortaea werneckii]KAI6880623.1 hypothetical protein KC325_g7123 [Hortaea werneckii]KAI6993394.1 hypothetical protein KC359_g5204 [Hortaea werneckii]KAI7142592.1 hypothetical protein KC344_g7068 [Hortaea werneckii]KAI7171368.1 hypothetical protein KC360_g6204 [Hortaea werneckii]